MRRFRGRCKTFGVVRSARKVRRGPGRDVMQSPWARPTAVAVRIGRDAGLKHGEVCRSAVRGNSLIALSPTGSSAPAFGVDQSPSTSR